MLIIRLYIELPVPSILRFIYYMATNVPVPVSKKNFKILNTISTMNPKQ
jgi:hypothetical protein